MLPLANPHASALLLRDCTVRGSALACRLDSVLHALYVTAWFLAVAFILAVSLAIALYNRRKADTRDVL